MDSRALGNTGLAVSPIGFGAFKIGRNQGTKYRDDYQLPDLSEVEQLLHGVLDLGITHLDTAPAYGLSEERIGKFLAQRRNEFVLSTKVGESFEGGVSTYDYSPASARASIHRSLRRLRTEVLDIVLIHSNGDDLHILSQTDLVDTLLNLKTRGLIKAVGMSGKTALGTRQALEWADVVMVEYHQHDSAHAEVIAEAQSKGVGVFVKKGLASGTLPPEPAIRFVLGNQNVSSLVVGGLNIEHLKSNIAVADEVIRSFAA